MPKTRQARSAFSGKSYITTGKRISSKDIPVVKVIGDYLPFGYGLCVKHRLIVCSRGNFVDCYQCGYELRKGMS